MAAEHAGSLVSFLGSASHGGRCWGGFSSSCLGSELEFKGGCGGDPRLSPTLGTVLPGVPRALKALVPSVHFHLLGKSLWTRIFEDFGGYGSDPERPVFSSGMHSTQIYPVGVMFWEQAIGGEGRGRGAQVTKEPAV